MPRDPRWTDELAAEIRGLIDEDDGPDQPLVLDNPDGILDLEGTVEGDLDGFADQVDFIPIELDRFGLYTFLSTASPEGDPATVLPTELTIFDAEGYLLLSVDAAEFYIEGPGIDTIFQFRPDESGLHYLAVSFAVGEGETPPTGIYGLSGAVDFGEVDPETGNTSPLARDALLRTRTFETEALDPDRGDFDADGDELFIAEIVQQPERGIVGLVDGEIIYRSDRDFAGVDSFEYRVSDGNGGSDIGRVVVEVGEPPQQGVSTAEAQRIAYLYEAGLDRDGDIDEPGLNFWIDQFGAGRPIADIAAAFLVSDEFTAAFGAIDTLDDEAYVTALYANVLDREGDTPGIDFWLEQLDQGSLSRAETLIAFADSAENLFGSPEIADLTLGEGGDWAFA